MKIIISRLSFERGTEKDLRKLSGTARDIFYFTEEFGKPHNDCNNVYVYMLEDQIQQILGEYFGCFFTKTYSDHDTIVQW